MAKIKVGSYDSPPIEKNIDFVLCYNTHSVLNKDQNHYCYSIFLKKCSYRLAKK